VAAFFRFGFQKTSMDDVARGAGLSRQALYLRYPSKEELFRAAVLHLLQGTTAAARAALHDDEKPLNDRLVGAFLALHGAHFTQQMSLQHMDELLEVAERLLGDAIPRQQQAFFDDVTKAVRAVAVQKGVNAKELTAALQAAAIGLKHTAASAADYEKRMRSVVRVMMGDAS
jgi:TetR/AcrR family transcriptional regulator of autoinduction and epiphytic fitness